MTQDNKYISFGSKSLTIKEVPSNSVLHISKFYNTKGMWAKKITERQNLIVQCAMQWFMMKNNKDVSKSMYFYKQYETHLTSLYKSVYDYHNIFDVFFTVQKEGFFIRNIEDKIKNPSRISPKKLPDSYDLAVQELLMNVEFTPEEVDLSQTTRKSKVRIIKQNITPIIKNLVEENRYDLIPQVVWLSKQKPELTVHYTAYANGDADSREGSIYPIKRLENWPSWLRTKLFGTVVDIENSYCQFLVGSVNKYINENIENPKLKNFFEKNCDELVSLTLHKEAYRNKIAEMIFKTTKVNEAQIRIVKKVIMAIANGSRITIGLMFTNYGQRSVACETILEALRRFGIDEDRVRLKAVCEKLHKLSKQFALLRKFYFDNIYSQDKTIAKLSRKEKTRIVFAEYFKWEAIARHKIHQCVGGTGLMLHDGIDGIVTDMDNESLKKFIEAQTNIKISIK